LKDKNQRCVPDMIGFGRQFEIVVIYHRPLDNNSTQNKHAKIDATNLRPVSIVTNLSPRNIYMASRRLKKATGSF